MGLPCVQRPVLCIRTCCRAAAAGCWPHLPPQSVPAGHLILSRAPLAPAPESSCHLLCVQLTGQAAPQFLAGLHELPFLAKGGSCPAAAELMDRLAEEKPPTAVPAASWPLPCCASFRTPTVPRPPCRRWCRPPLRHPRKLRGPVRRGGAQRAAGRLKSHLVRTFTAAMGVPPGKYLTTVRIEAAQRLLLHREYTLDVVASLCGFSGANYLCRVFKKPANPPHSGGQWPVTPRRVGLTPEESMREQELYI